MLARAFSSRFREIRQVFPTSHQVSLHCPNHTDTPDNNPNPPWEFSDKNKEQVKKILSKYPYTSKETLVAPLLYLAQQQHGGWLPVSAMDAVAKVVGVAPNQAYEIVTRYPKRFYRKPVGKYHVLVCGAQPCLDCFSRSNDNLDALLKHFGVEINEVTEDGLISVGETGSLGCDCDGRSSPVIRVADYSNRISKGFSYYYYEWVSPEEAVRVVEMLRKGGRLRVDSPWPDRIANCGPEVVDDLDCYFRIEE